MKRLAQYAVLALLGLCTVSIGHAQQMKGFRADLIGQISYGQKEIMDLEDAIPVAKMTWRPAKGVRSISEVYSHIAFGNYLFAKFAGITIPDGVMTGSQDDEKKWEMMSTDKKVIHDQLAKSFDVLINGIKGLSDDGLDDMVSFFGQQMSKRAVLMAGLAHQREHLGQSIAYARMNGVVPPWTAAEMAAAKAKSK